MQSGLARRMDKRVQFDTVLVAAALVLMQLPACGAELTSQTVQKIIKDAKLWPGAHTLQVSCSANTVFIAANRGATETDRDCKIDAVLLTRKIQAADRSVTRVTIRFYDVQHPHAYKQIEVRQTDIAAFASRLVNDETLLSGISITAGQDLPEVVPGPFGEERAAIKLRLGNLQNQGVGISAFLRLFSQVEELATQANKEESTVGVDDQNSKATVAELRRNMDLLLSNLDEQDAALKRLRERSAAKRGNAFAAAAMHNGDKAPATATVGRSVLPAHLDLGPFKPTTGPYLVDRLRIGNTLNQQLKQGNQVTNLLPIWQRMDAAANSHQDEQVKSDVDYLDLQLNLPAISEEERQRYSVIQY